MGKNRILLAVIGMVVSAWGARAAILPDTYLLYNETGPTVNADGSESITYNFNIKPSQGSWNFDFPDAAKFDDATVTIGLDPGAIGDITVNLYDGTNPNPLKSFSETLSGQTSISFDPPFSDPILTVNIGGGGNFLVDTLVVKLSAPDIGSSATLLGLGLAGLAGFRRSKFCAKA